MKEYNVGITKRIKLLLYIDNYIRKNGYGPTYKEMVEKTGFTQTNIFKHVEILVKQGLFKKDKRGNLYINKV